MSIGVNFRSGNNIVEASFNKLANTDADGSLGLSCVAFKDQKDSIQHDRHEDVGKASEMLQNTLGK